MSRKTYSTRSGLTFNVERDQNGNPVKASGGGFVADPDTVNDALLAVILADEAQHKAASASATNSAKARQPRMRPDERRFQAWALSLKHPPTLAQSLEHTKAWPSQPDYSTVRRWRGRLPKS